MRAYLFYMAFSKMKRTWSQEMKTTSPPADLSGFMHSTLHTLERYIAHELFTRSLDPEEIYYD
jgi:hypothetical protein